MKFPTSNERAKKGLVFFIAVFFLLAKNLSAISVSSRTILSSDYTPGVPIEVNVFVIPDSTTLAYGLEERPPLDWAINVKISTGVTMSPGLIKVGIFLDNLPRTLSYIVIPSTSSVGVKTFSGIANFNGNNVTITGNTQIVKRPNSSGSVVATKNFRNVLNSRLGERIYVPDVPQITAVFVVDPKGGEIKRLSSFGGFFSWDGRNQSNIFVANGIYFLKIRDAVGDNFSKVLLLN